MGTSLKKLGIHGGMWLVIRKGLTQWGIADSEGIAGFYQRALEKSGEFPKPSKWLQVIVKSKVDGAIDAQMKSMALEH